MPGLFSTLNIATRGMSVQQKALDVTSHNIANANTPGYSRQRALIETTTPFGMPTLNNAKEPGQLGTGAQISAIQRYRDAFLDYQTRVETSTKGQFDTRQTVLGEVESIFNEPTDTGISTLMGQFFDSWQKLSTQPQSSSTRTSVAQQSAALTDSLNHTYTQLQKLKENTQLDTKNTVVDINSKLKQLDLLNQQIRGVSIGGNNANDLMDKRDLLLDQLSSEFNINVTDKDFSGIDFSPVDTPGANFNMINSVKDGTEKSLSYISDIQPPTPPVGAATQRYTITYYSNGDMSNAANKHTIVMDGVDAKTFKTIDESRVLWTDNNGIAVDATGAEVPDNALPVPPGPGAGYSFNNIALFQPSDGEVKGESSVQNDIDDYIDQLNNLARALAFSVNAVHSGMTDPLSTSGNQTADGLAATPVITPPTSDNMPFFVNSDVASYNANGSMSNLGAILAGEQNITAGNISVNKQILSDVMQIKTGTNDDLFTLEGSNTIDGDLDGTRALGIAQLRATLINVQDMGSNITQRSDMFSGTENTLTNHGMTVTNSANGMTMDNYFTDTVDRLGIQSQEAQRMVKNQDNLLANFDQSRASVSGVSLDEEMANLVQYQHAYQANAKIISTIDELLDVVVNGLKK